MSKVYLFKNPKTGRITEHASNVPRSDPISNVMLEFVGEKVIGEAVKDVVPEVPGERESHEVKPKGKRKK